MLKEFVDKKHYVFADHADTWQDAIRMACKPLIDDGTIQAQYAEDIIASVGKYGSYFVLMPGLAMPHAQEGGGKVFKTTISFMKLEKPVQFPYNEEDGDTPEDKQASLFFTLAACDHNEHLEHMAQLMEVFENEDLMEEIGNAKGPDDLLALADKYNM